MFQQMGLAALFSIIISFLPLIAAAPTCSGRRSSAWP